MYNRFYTSIAGAIALLVSLVILGVGSLLLYGVVVWRWSDSSLYAGLAMCIASIGFMMRYMYVLFGDSISG